MVRQRLGIAQDAAGTVAQRLHEGLERWVPEPADREFLAPRLGVLLGLAERSMPRAELFAGWRVFFARLAEQAPVVLVFEDLQWADEGCSVHRELLDWSRRARSSSSRSHATSAGGGSAAGRPGGAAPRPAARAASRRRDAGQLLDALVDGLRPRARAG